MKNRALITGASGGIGRAIAVRLAGEGHAILGQGRRGKALEDTAGAVRRAGGTFEARCAEFADMGAVEELGR